jgi:methylenetetrahydrofolate dehydrogenase (NAD+)
MAEIHADPAPAPVPKGVLLKADTIAEPFLAEVKANLTAILSPSSTRGRPPKLVGILATASAAPSRSYAEFTRKQCVALGIAFELREVEQDDGVEEAIIEANADSAVDGIMVRFFFAPISRSSIFSENNLPRCTTRFSGRNR